MPRSVPLEYCRYAPPGHRVGLPRRVLWPSLRQDGREVKRGEPASCRTLSRRMLFRVRSRVAALMDGKVQRPEAPVRAEMVSPKRDAAGRSLAVRLLALDAHLSAGMDRTLVDGHERRHGNPRVKNQCRL